MESDKQHQLLISYVTLGRLFNFPNLYFPDNILDILITYLDFPGVSVVKNPSANAGDSGLIPGSGRSLEEEMATHSSILAWRIPWAEEHGGLQSVGSQRVRQRVV